MKIIIKNNNHNCRQHINDAVCSVQTKRRLNNVVNEQLSMKNRTYRKIQKKRPNIYRSLLENSIRQRWN